jgi:hypothetical protein
MTVWEGVERTAALPFKPSATATTALLGDIWRARATGLTPRPAASLDELRIVG